MPRPRRDLQANFCYHVTIRCNNREFKLLRRECREVLLYALQRAMEKFRFKLYGICIMSNHIHYLLEPQVPEDLPKIMHWINWYSAMCFNQMLHRTGHFWEKRYHSTGFDSKDYRRALNTLRYIHANPKTAGMQAGFFYDFSDYGIYDRLGDDGLTQWHPAFLALGESLDECAQKYRGFCRRYQPKPKPDKGFRWGSKLLPKLLKLREQKKRSPGQMKLPWGEGMESNPEIKAVAKKFVLANCFDPKVASQFFDDP